jgi:hypothetical protein
MEVGRGMWQSFRWFLGDTVGFCWLTRRLVLDSHQGPTELVLGNRSFTAEAGCSLFAVHQHSSTILPGNSLWEESTQCSATIHLSAHAGAAGKRQRSPFPLPKLPGVLQLPEYRVSHPDRLPSVIQPSAFGSI